MPDSAQSHSCMSASLPQKWRVYRPPRAPCLRCCCGSLPLAIGTPARRSKALLMPSVLSCWLRHRTRGCGLSTVCHPWSNPWRNQKASATMVAMPDIGAQGHAIGAAQGVRSDGDRPLSFSLRHAPQHSTLHSTVSPAHIGRTTVSPKVYSPGMVHGARRSVTVLLFRGSP